MSMAVDIPNNGQSTTIYQREARMSLAVLSPLIVAQPTSDGSIEAYDKVQAAAAITKFYELLIMEWIRSQPSSRPGPPRKLGRDRLLLIAMRDTRPHCEVRKKSKSRSSMSLSSMLGMSCRESHWRRQNTSINPRSGINKSCCWRNPCITACPTSGFNWKATSSGSMGKICWSDYPRN